MKKRVLDLDSDSIYRWILTLNELMLSNQNLLLSFMSHPIEIFLLDKSFRMNHSKT